MFKARLAEAATLEPVLPTAPDGGVARRPSSCVTAVTRGEAGAQLAHHIGRAAASAAAPFKKEATAAAEAYGRT